MKHLGKACAVVALATAALFMAGCQTDNADGKYSYDPLAQSAPPANSGGGNMVASTAPMVPATSADPTMTRLSKGDRVTFSFTDIKDAVSPIEDTVKEDGSVTLIYNEKFQAEGKTIGDLQNEIRDRYVPKYFKYLTVNIKPSERYYYVGGEVHMPNRFIYSGRMTILGAIDTAGGFSDFARKGKVQITRANGESMYVDCRKALDHPEMNKEIFPGDKIQVYKRIW